MPTWKDYQKWLGNEWRNDHIPQINPPNLSDISTDSRTIGSGDWFLPLCGPNFDGHNFIEDVIAKGAAGFFFSNQRKTTLNSSFLKYGVAVSDPLTAYQRAASGWRSELKNLSIVALTGSSGKTTTKEILGSILKQVGKTLATQASFNNEIGVPKTLAMLTQDDRFAAVEMGARHIGNIKFLCELVKPNVVGLLNVGSAHLGEFGSYENLLNTKLEIFRDSPAESICIASQDDHRILNGAKATGKKTITFGYAPESNVQIINAIWNVDGSISLSLRTPIGQIDTRLATAHESYPINAAAACAMAIACGANKSQIAEGLSEFKGIKGRFQIHRKGALVVIDDTYNANPESMRAGLKTLGRLFNTQKRVVILGDMLELGKNSDFEHQKIGEFCVKEVRPEFIFAIGGYAKQLIDGAEAAGYPRSSTRIFTNVDEFLNANLHLADLGDVIYAKASNGIKLSRIIEALLR